MSTTKHIKFYPLISSCSLNSTALIYSAPIDMRTFDDFGLQAKWTGTPTGSFFLDASVNYIPNQNIQIIPSTGTAFDIGDWVPASTSIGQALGSSGIFSFPPITVGSTNVGDLKEVCYPWYRMRFVPSSASTSGVLNVWVAAKQLS